MREYVNRQKNRRWVDLTHDSFVVGMLVLCVWGGWFSG